MDLEISIWSRPTSHFSRSIRRVGDRHEDLVGLKRHIQHFPDSPGQYGLPADTCSMSCSCLDCQRLQPWTPRRSYPVLPSNPWPCDWGLHSDSTSRGEVSKCSKHVREAERGKQSQHLQQRWGRLVRCGQNARSSIANEKRSRPD